MSNSVFPDLPGLKIEIKRTPIWKTLKQESASGRVVTAALMTYPLRRYGLSFEFLRSGGGYTELQQVEAFFNQHKGAYESFLFNDPDDNAVVDQVFGTGNGTQTSFPLLRTRGGFSEPVQSVNGVPTIKVNGVTKATPADYTISANGIVVFAVAPPAGHALTWTGSYYWRCRFVNDTSEFERFMFNLWKLNSIDFVTVKQ